MSDLFEVREDGPVTILSLKPTDDLIATDFQDGTAVLQVLYGAPLAEQKVLLIEITDGRLSPAAVLVNRVVERGVSPGNALLWYLSRLVGGSRAMELLLEGRSLTAAEARELAIVNRVTAPGDLRNVALAFAKELAEKPAAALSTLMAARSALHIGLDSYLEEIGVGFEHLPRQQQQ